MERNYEDRFLMPVHFLDACGPGGSLRSRIPICVTHLEEPRMLDGLARAVLAQETELKSKHREAIVGGAGAIRNSLTARYYAYNLLLWEFPFIAPLRRFFFESYMELLTCLPTYRRQKSYIQCWANTVRKEEYIELHNHGGKESYFSGNIAVQVKNPGQSYTHYLPVGREINDWRRVSLCNRPGLLTIFPSYVYHFTDPWPHDDTRITVAFDIVSQDVAERQTQYHTGRQYILFDDPHAQSHP